MKYWTKENWNQAERTVNPAAPHPDWYLGVSIGGTLLTLYLYKSQLIMVFGQNKRKSTRTVQGSSIYPFFWFFMVGKPTAHWGQSKDLVSARCTAACTWSIAAACVYLLNNLGKYFPRQLSFRWKPLPVVFKTAIFLLWTGKTTSGRFGTPTQPHILQPTICPGFVMWWDNCGTETMCVAKEYWYILRSLP